MLRSHRRRRGPPAVRGALQPLARDVAGSRQSKYRVWFSPETSGSSHRRTTPSESLVNHPGWRLVHKIELHKVWRQADGDPLLQKLGYLRKNRPMGSEGDAFVRDLCRQHKAWSGHHEPANLDIEDFFQKTDGKTTVVTCTRRGAALVNALIGCGSPRRTARKAEGRQHLRGLRQQSGQLRHPKQAPRRS